MQALCIIIPVFNEYENIQPLYSDLCRYITTDSTLLFIDDGSTDNSLLQIEELASKDSRVRCVSLSRNFGHQQALIAGIHHATGKINIIMDGDGQHPPSLIPEMVKRIESGYDIVHTKRISTGDISFFKKITGSIFYSFINKISDVHIEPNAADFKAFNEKVKQSILQFPERDLFLRGVFSWIGYKNCYLEFDAPARKYGKSKYGFYQMFRLALRGTTSFGFKPLRLALMTGSFISLAAFSFGIYALIAYFRGETIPGWASLIIAIMFLGGTQLLAIGLLGEYIASLFTESKKRPQYLIDRTINC